MTEDQLTLLRDKFVLWDRAAREGPMDLRDYNRRAADALKALLAEQAEYWRLHEARKTPEATRDDPDLDATDAAHPAWWRAHDHTSKVFCGLVTNILDGKDAGGGFNHEPWHTLRRRLLAEPRPLPSREVHHGIYVASRASVLARGEMWRAWRAKGAPIISSWIDEDGPNDTADLDELWVRIRREVTSADRLVLYVEPDDFPLKGAFVEIGMALAAGVPITIVAPGVEIKDRNCRPFGSWIKHPLVSFAPTVADAILAAGREG